MGDFDLARLDDLIATCRRLGGRELVAEIARDAVPGVDAAVKATARAGRSPDGQTWAPRKADGSPALPNAADAISTKAIGNKIVVMLKGPTVYAHMGANGPRRIVIPDSTTGTPAAVFDAIEEVAARACARASQAGAR